MLTKIQFLQKKTRGGVVRSTLTQQEQDSAWKAYLGSMKGQQGGQSTRVQGSGSPKKQNSASGGKTAGWVPGFVQVKKSLSGTSKEGISYGLSLSGGDDEIFKLLPERCLLTSVQLEVDMPLSEAKRSWAIGVLKSDKTGSIPTTQKVRELKYSQSSQEEVVCKNYPLPLAGANVGKGLKGFLSGGHADDDAYLLLVAQMTKQAQVDFKINVHYVAPKGVQTDVFDI